MRYPGFIGSSDMTQSSAADVERTMNLYLEILPKHAKSRAALYPTPGQRVLITVADIGVRALSTMNDRTLTVIATGVYGVDLATNTGSLYGRVTQDQYVATISRNGTTGNQAFITSANQGYNLDLATNTLTQVLTDKATQGGMLDGYFVAFDKPLSRISLSDLDDGTTWDPTQFAPRGDAADGWQAMLITAPDIWLIGSQTGCVWYNAGNFPFPFLPRPGANFKYGTPASSSLAAVGNAVFWLSQNQEGAGIVVRARGYTPIPISTPPVESAIAGYQRTSTIADAEAWTYQSQGHPFYVLRFPTAQATWVYDLSTDHWHERGTWIARENRYDAWHPRVHCHANGQHLVGDAMTGTINVMDEAIGTEADGTEIRRLRIAPGLCDEHRPLLIRRFEIHLDTGVGTSTGQGVDPIIMLRSSDDGGQTWGPERHGHIGKIGAYRTTVVFTRMGIPTDRVYELTMSDPVPYRLIDAYVNNERVA